MGWTRPSGSLSGHAREGSCSTVNALQSWALPDLGCPGSGDFGSVGVLPRRVGSGLKPCEEDGRPLGPPPWPGVWVTSMNPPSLEGTTMAPTTSLHSFFRALTGRSSRWTASHPDAVPEAGLNLPRRIDDPASAARVARDLLRSRREDVTLVLYMDDRHRFVGHAVVAVGWVQAARLSAHPLLLGAQACRATGSVLVLYRRYGASSVTEAEQASFRAIAAACGRHGLAVVDHLVVVGR